MRALACFFSPILCFPTSSIPPLFLPHITQASYAFFFLFYLVLHEVSNHLPFAYISLASLFSTPLHHENQLRFIPHKLNFILLDSLACPKINIAIYCMLHACCTKTCIAFVGPWRIKGGRDDLFLSPDSQSLSPDLSSK